MFGYIRIDKNSLNDEEYERYRAIYCSLCKQLGKEYSPFARWILSYDCTFYALLILSLTKECPRFKDGRCRFNPVKRCSYCSSDVKALSQAAALSVSCVYFKLTDNIRDAGFFKRLGCRLIKPVVSRWRNKAKKKYFDIDQAVEAMIMKQQKVEDSPFCTVDEAADPTAVMLSTICQSIPDDFDLNISFDTEKQKRIFSVIGYYLGRWIYLMDAADDFLEDRNSGGFNPFLLAGYDENNLPEHVLPILNHSLSEVLLSYSLLDKGRYDVIISDILYSACVKIQKFTLSKYEQNSDKRSKDEKSL